MKIILHYRKVHLENTILRGGIADLLCVRWGSSLVVCREDEYFCTTTECLV